MTETFLIEEPLFITEEIEAEMVKAGYVFEPPQHVSFQDAQDLTQGKLGDDPHPAGRTDSAALYEGKLDVVVE